MDDETQLGPALDTFFEVLNSGDYSKLDDVFTEDFRRVGPDFGASHRDEMIAGVKQIDVADPDFHLQMNESSFSEDLGFCQWTATATTTTADGTTAGVGWGAALVRVAVEAAERTHFDSGTRRGRLLCRLTNTRRSCPP